MRGDRALGPGGDDAARELWRRAVELQREAEARPVDAGALPVQRSAGPPSVAPALQVAREVGIPADHVLLALTEQRLTGADAVQHEQPSARWLRRIVDDPHADALEVARVIAAPPARVAAAIETVTGAEEWHMLLEERIGDDPGEGMAFLYRPAPQSPLRAPLDLADARVLLMALHGTEGGTRLRIRIPLYRRGVNAAVGGGSVALGGGIAGAAGLEAATGLLGAAAVGAAAATGALAALAGGALGLWGFRRLYRWASGTGETVLHSLVRAIALEAESQDGTEGGDERDARLTAG